MLSILGGIALTAITVAFLFCFIGARDFSGSDDPFRRGLGCLFFIGFVVLGFILWIFLG